MIIKSIKQKKIVYTIAHYEEDPRINFGQFRQKGVIFPSFSSVAMNFSHQWD